MIANNAENSNNTYDDYARLGYRAPYQLIKGELVFNPSPTPQHQRISRRLGSKLERYVEENECGEIFFAPLDVYLFENSTLQPDIMFVSLGNLKVIGPKKIEGAPDLIVEILSPSTARYDLNEKKQVYEEAGVQEYWVANPALRTVYIYESSGDCGFSVKTRASIGGSITSTLFPGLSIHLKEIFP